MVMLPCSSAPQDLSEAEALRNLQLMQHSQQTIAVKIFEFLRDYRASAVAIDHMHALGIEPPIGSF